MQDIKAITKHGETLFSVRKTPSSFRAQVTIEGFALATAYLKTEQEAVETINRYVAHFTQNGGFILN